MFYFVFNICTVKGFSTIFLIYSLHYFHIYTTKHFLYSRYNNISGVLQTALTHVTTLPRTVRNNLYPYIIQHRHFYNTFLLRVLPHFTGFRIILSASCKCLVIPRTLTADRNEIQTTHYVARRHITSCDVIIHHVTSYYTTLRHMAAYPHPPLFEGVWYSVGNSIISPDACVLCEPTAVVIPMFMYDGYSWLDRM